MRNEQTAVALNRPRTNETKLERAVDEVLRMLETEVSTIHLAKEQAILVAIQARLLAARTPGGD